MAQSEIQMADPAVVSTVVTEEKDSLHLIECYLNREESEIYHMQAKAESIRRDVDMISEFPSSYQNPEERIYKHECTLTFLQLALAKKMETVAILRNFVHIKKLAFQSVKAKFLEQDD